MQELIERLEKATEPDRALDGRIALAVDPDRFKELVLTPESDLRSLASVFGVHRYTESIDAAVTLVSDGYDFKIVRRAKHPVEGRWPYEVWINNGAPIGSRAYRGESGFALTPAIALCIAALKVREMITGEAELLAQI